MSRATFGATAGDFVSIIGPGNVVRVGPATLTIWSAKTGGTQYTDLLLDGAPVTQIPVGRDGQVPEFEGPDGVSEVWADAGGGSRVRLVPDIVGALVTEDAAVSTLIANPASDTAAALAGEIAREVGARAGTGMQRLAGLLEQRRGSAVVAVLGDSTADEGPEWPTKTLVRLAAERPWLKFDRYVWADATSSPWSDTASGAFGAAVAVQAGTADEITGRLWSDSFAGAAGEIVGTASTPGQSARTWNGGSGLWQRDGAGGLVTVAAGSGINAQQSGTASARRISFTLTLPQTGDKHVNLWTGVNSSNRVQFYVRNNAGVWRWQVWKQVAGAGAEMLAWADIPTLPTDGSLTTVEVECEVNGTDVIFRVNDQTRTATLSSGEATAVSGRWIGIDTSGAVGVTTRITDLALDLLASREIPTLTLYNAAKAGTTLAYQLPRLSRMLTVEPDVVLIGSSHNYGTGTATAYLTALDETVAAVKALWPDTYIVVSSQNPELPPVAQADRDAHRDRCLALREHARANGWGYIAAFEQFTADGPDPLRTRADGVHPTGDNAAYDGAPDPANGSWLWSEAALDYLATEGITKPA